jgi:hypothetical protein
MHPLSSVPKPGPSSPGAELPQCPVNEHELASLLYEMATWHRWRSHHTWLSPERREYHRTQSKLILSRLEAKAAHARARAGARLRAGEWERFCAGFRPPL